VDARDAVADASPPLPLFDFQRFVEIRNLLPEECRFIHPRQYAFLKKLRFGFRVSVVRVISSDSTFETRKTATRTRKPICLLRPFHRAGLISIDLIAA